MGFLQKFGKVIDWVINPIGAAAQAISPKSSVTKFLNPADTLYSGLNGYNEVSSIAEELGGKGDIGVNNAWNWLTEGDGAKGISKVWDDLTGISAIKAQNAANKEAAEFENEMALANIGKTKDAYINAGLNPNLMYGSGASSASYPSISQQGYSGSDRIDSILGRAGKVLNFIPALYQATAALEGIDQAREATHQSQLRTTAMGLNILDTASKIDNRMNGLPYDLDINYFRTKGVRGRNNHVNLLSGDIVRRTTDDDLYPKYVDASLRHRFGLLDSIQLANDLARTRNSYLGYQYDLDKRFGAAGRIVGMASQGLGSIGNLLKIPALYKPKVIR